MKKGKDQKKISPSKIRKRDTEEFERMFRKYFLRLAKYAYQYVNSTAVAQDLTQSVFLRIWEMNGKWNPDGTIKSYLYLAVKNRCLNYNKHKKVEDEWKSENAEASVQSEMKMVWDRADREDQLKKAVNRALEKMPKKRREVYELSRNEGLTYKEIADAQDISKKTVENHMGNALQFLKEELSDWI